MVGAGSAQASSSEAQCDGLCLPTGWGLGGQGPWLAMWAEGGCVALQPPYRSLHQALLTSAAR